MRAGWHSPLKRLPRRAERCLVHCLAWVRPGEDDGVRLGRWRTEGGGFFLVDADRLLPTEVSSWYPYPRPPLRGERRYLLELTPSMRLGYAKLRAARDGGRLGVEWFSAPLAREVTEGALGLALLEALARRRLLDRSGQRYRFRE